MANETALILAVERGIWDIVDILVRHGADVNVKGKQFVCQSSNINTTITGSSGQTPLIVAADKGNLDIVNLLLKSGADVHERFGQTISTDFPNIEVVFSGSANETALALAAKNGYWGIVKLLVEHGVDVNVKLGKNYVCHNLRILTLSLQVPLVKRHLCLQCGGETTWTLLRCLLRLVRM